MKNMAYSIIFCLSLAMSVMAQNGNNNDQGENQNRFRGGSGVPEPATVMLIIGGLGAAYGIKKALKK